MYPNWNRSLERVYLIWYVDRIWKSPKAGVQKDSLDSTLIQITVKFFKASKLQTIGTHNTILKHNFNWSSQTFESLGWESNSCFKEYGEITSICRTSFSRVFLRFFLAVSVDVTELLRVKVSKIIPGSCCGLILYYQ